MPLLQFRPYDFIRYVVYQLELGTSGNLHFQGYMELTRVCRMTQIKSMEGFEGAHLEIRKGTREQARAYCMEEDTRVEGPWEYGEWIRGERARTDLDSVCEKVKKGASDFEIVVDHASTYVRYYKGLTSLRNVVSENKRDTKTPVTLVYGDPGSGKSRLVREWVSENDPYYKMPGNGWWDGYNGTSPIVLDDFNGKFMAYTEWLQLCDRYPMRVQMKGASISIDPCAIFMTSTALPEEWWKHRYVDPAAIYRRITRYIYIDKDREEQHFGEGEEVDFLFTVKNQ